jgi:PAS domain S-box-containing protein
MDQVGKIESTIFSIDRSKPLFDAIVDASNDAILCKDLGGINRWNGAAGRLFGHSADEMIGQKIVV